ncbi:MAG: hypothetical protein Q8916_14615, partial [Bacteroidota bacterium]|nr:hypothetical protein [Bacteroidota bacterium]
MKYLLLFLLVFPAFVLAQTPVIYDEWSPALFGSTVHVKISKHEIIVRHQSSGLINELPQFLTAPMPEGDNPSAAPEMKESHSEKLDTARLLKVVYDSAKAKGRLFFEFAGKDASSDYGPYIIPLTFWTKDNGEMEIGLAPNALESAFEKKTLKEVERSSRKSATPHKTGRGPCDPNLDFLGDFTYTFYSSQRTAEYAKLKDPNVMPKEEMIGMINSFGNRCIAEFQKLPQDTTENFIESMLIVKSLFKNIQQVGEQLFLAHGYNPLAVGAAIERFKSDSDIIAATKTMGDKIEESVPSLRKDKERREARRRSYHADSAIVPPEAIPAAPTPPPPPIDPTSSSSSSSESEFADVTEEPKPLQNVQSLVVYP